MLRAGTKLIILRNQLLPPGRPEEKPKFSKVVTGTNSWHSFQNRIEAICAVVASFHSAIANPGLLALLRSNPFEA
jgi:hypothetical protein